MLTLYVPGAVLLLGEKVRLKDPVPPEDNLTLMEPGLIGRPIGDKVTETVTLPWNPSRLDSDTFALPDVPWTIDWDNGLTDNAKSGRATAAVNASWSTQLP